MILPPVLRGLMLSDVSLFHQTVDLIGGVGRRDLHKGGKFIHRGTAKGHNGLHAEGLHSGETGLPVLKAAKDLLIKMQPVLKAAKDLLIKMQLEFRIHVKKSLFQHGMHVPSRKFSDLTAL